MYLKRIQWVRMKLAIIGSRGIMMENLEKYLPDCVDEIVSGGAKGIDGCAAAYARKKGIKLTEFFPEYQKYGRAAPLRRNETIAEYADEAIAFWDGKSRGTKYTVEAFHKLGKRVKVIIVKDGSKKGEQI